MIRLFEIDNKVVKVTEHCYIIPWLKAIIDKYPEPEEHLKRLAYVFYMTCPNQENPYYNVRYDIREKTIIDELEITFDTEEDILLTAIDHAQTLYETVITRAHRAVTTMLDNISDYIENTKVTAGRDGNITALIRLAKDFNEIRASYKGISKDVEEEQKAMAYGKQDLAYDQT